jgi:hypothetical protein
VAQTRVDITLNNAPSNVPQPAHFRAGTCSKFNPNPQYPLSDVVNGKSSSTVNVPLAQLVGKPHTITVHKSAEELKTTVACGDVKKG